MGNFTGQNFGIYSFYKNHIESVFTWQNQDHLPESSKFLLSHYCHPSSIKPTCKPWCEPWSEASVVLPHWFVALVWTSLAIVTLTSLKANRSSNKWHNFLSKANKMTNEFFFGSVQTCGLIKLGFNLQQKWFGFLWKWGPIWVCM